MSNRIRELQAQCWDNQSNNLDAESFAKLLLEDSKEENFNLGQEIIRLRGQVTYLQEEVATLEDQVFILKISLDYARNIEV